MFPASAFTAYMISRINSTCWRWFIKILFNKNHCRLPIKVPKKTLFTIYNFNFFFSNGISQPNHQLAYHWWKYSTLILTGLWQRDLLFYYNKEIVIITLRKCIDFITVFHFTAMCCVTFLFCFCDSSGKILKMKFCW